MATKTTTLPEMNCPPMIVRTTDTLELEENNNRFHILRDNERLTHIYHETQELKVSYRDLPSGKKQTLVIISLKN